MNYYIQGSPARAEEIKAAFKKLCYDTGNLEFTSSLLYYTIEGKVELMCPKSLQNIIKTHPDYKELELPVEPKFKVGDWIACDADSFTLSIKSVRDENYYFHQGASLPIKDIDEHYHLWTLADAKDGDVLAVDWHQDDDDDSWEKIVIFKKYHAKGVKGLFNSPCVEGYGNTFKNGKLAYDEEVPYYSKTWTDKLQPATKEQRDLLFAKMKEAGYEWDAENKTLNKIQPHYDIANFKPFDKVLVRDRNDEPWRIAFYGYYNEEAHYSHFVGTCWSKQCIPYNDDTKHLLGTTDMPSEEYINW